MSDKQLEVWLNNKGHSVEGHTLNCTLTFRDRVIWGPMTCHDNTISLKNAIHGADPRFDMTFAKKEHTVEGHTRSISVKSKGQVLLDNFSTHDNMAGLFTAINAVLSVVD